MYLYLVQLVLLEVIEVTANLACRVIVNVQVPTLDLRKATGKELLLDHLSDAHFVLDSLALAQVVVMLADQEGHSDGRRRMAAELFEQAVVLGRVIRVTQAGAEIEHPDQLSLTQKRNDKLHFDVPKALERLGDQVFTVQVDRVRRPTQLVYRDRVELDLIEVVPKDLLRPPSNRERDPVHLFRVFP